MRLLFAIALIVLAAPAVAEEKLCSSEWVQKVAQCDDISKCAGDALVQSDTELNRVYSELKADLVKPKSFIQAQRAWLAFRKAECEYQSSGYNCESGISGMCSIERAMCGVHLTCERVRKLRGHIEENCNGCPVRKGDATRPNKAVNTDAQGRPLAALAPSLGRGLLLR
jgi:uncharacterized protein YecT (DUF1311 family)